MIDRPTEKALAQIRKDFRLRFKTTTPICELAGPRAKAESDFLAKLQDVFVHVLAKKDPRCHAPYLHRAVQFRAGAEVFVIKGGFFRSTITITPLRLKDGKNPEWSWRIHTALHVYTLCGSNWKWMKEWPRVPTTYNQSASMLQAFGFKEANRLLTPAFGHRSFHLMSGDWTVEVNTLEDAANAINAIFRTDCDQGYDNLVRPGEALESPPSIEEKKNPALWIQYGVLQNHVAAVAPHGVWRTSQVMDYGVFRIQLETGWEYHGEDEPIQSLDGTAQGLIFSVFCDRMAMVIPAGVISVDSENQIVLSPALRVTDITDQAWVYPMFDGDFGADSQPWFDRRSPVQVVWSATQRATDP